MIPQSISFIFFLIASVLSPMVFMGGYFMQQMQPNNKWFYVVYVAASALVVLALVFFCQLDFMSELATAMTLFTGLNAVISLLAVIAIKNK